MLKINMEYRKGILFIRLKGDLTKYTYKSLNNYLLPVINNQGIKYIVYNLENIQIIDKYGKDSLKAGITAAQNNHGLGLLCNTKLILNNEFKIVDNELSAMKLIIV